MIPELRITFRKTRLTEALLDGRVVSARLKLHYVPVDPISRAFRRAIRDGEFDVTEMAIVTLAMANDAGDAWRGLPIVLAGGFPHGALRVKVDSPIRTPEDLRGRTVGVRAYSQATGVWYRGVLASDYGISASQIRWITTEDAHVPGFVDPEYVARAPKGARIQDLFLAGEVDAAIGDSATNFGETRSAIPNPDEAAAAWVARTGVEPVNHLLALRPGLIGEFPWIGRELVRMFRESGAAVCGRAPIDMALEFSYAQGLTRRRFHDEDLFAAE